MNLSCYLSINNASYWLMKLVYQLEAWFLVGNNLNSYPDSGSKKNCLSKEKNSAVLLYLQNDDQQMVPYYWNNNKIFEGNMVYLLWLMGKGWHKLLKYQSVFSVGSETLFHGFRVWDYFGEYSFSSRPCSSGLLDR